MDRFKQAYLKETEEFINCILEDRRPSVSVSDGVFTTQIGFACKQSIETGTLIQIYKCSSITFAFHY